MDTCPITARSLERHYKVDADQLEKQYKYHLSDYSIWAQKDHAQDWLLFPENIGPYLSLDETSLSDGELYTILTNKQAKGKKGCLVAMIKGTNSDDIISILEKLPQSSQNSVLEITLDMANSMRKIAKSCFPKALITTDRFHVQKLCQEALQKMRIEYRWEALDQEILEQDLAKASGIKYKPTTLENGDSPKQLLARSRYLLFKSCDKWTVSQKTRANLLFDRYPKLKEAYNLTHALRMIYNNSKSKAGARLNLAKWYKKVEESGFKTFGTIVKTIYNNYEEILNFFVNRATNASAESFNAKIKSFRANLRGVSDINFFLFRLAKIYA